jgi:MFS family permease
MQQPNRDIAVLFCTRCTRLFAYGSLSVYLVLYLTKLGFSGSQIGTLLALTLAGDTVVSLWLTTRADRFGRRRTLFVGAALMAIAGAVFAVSDSFTVLLIAATIGVISPSGDEVGPFLAIEQAALSQVVSDRNRTTLFAWYTMAGTLATALGSLAGGLLIDALQRGGVPPPENYRVGAGGYAVLGVVLLLIFTQLSPSAEVAPKKSETDETETKTSGGWLGLTQSRGIVLRLSSLFALDAFGGGFVIQSLVAYWFFVRYHVDGATLGGIFCGANVLAGLSALAAARCAQRFGLINTMVFTHLPSNVLLILVPLMPNLRLAIAVLFVRFSISQMDVPTRQSYTMAVVPPQERSAAAGVTGVSRTIGRTLSQFIAGALLSYSALHNTHVPLDMFFYLSGGLKIVYDLLLYRGFVKHRPPEEMAISGFSNPQSPASNSQSPPTSS